MAMRPDAWAWPAAAVLAGFAMTAAIFGLHILPPNSTGWMLHGIIGPDPVQYWLGWTAFRQSPWTWPPGLNPGWGLDLASSVFLADAIPLLAFTFKALRGVVTVPQYWGLWLYACAGLQGWCAWRLLGLATADHAARLAGAMLFVLQPMLINRMGGHFALSAHFLLLLGLSLCLTRGTGWRRALAWAGLVTAAALIHAYLLPMVLALWAADWLARLVRHRPGLSLAAELLAIPACALAALWAAGLFVLRDSLGGDWGGYGSMQFDLLTWFDGNHWSLFLPNLPTAPHLEQDFAYAGLGSLGLMAAGIWAWCRLPATGLGRHWPLLLVLAGLMAFAITPHVTLAGREIVLFTLPEWAQHYADSLRASGRFAWPAYYALLFAAVWALARRLGVRRTRITLIALLALQLFDCLPGLRAQAAYFPAIPPQLPLRLTAPFWAEAAHRYQRIRMVPNRNRVPGWEEVAVYAAVKGLQTDAVYLARLDDARVAALNARTGEELRTGQYEPGTLYVLTDAAAQAAARAAHNPARDLMGRFNGLEVLAPGWFAGRAVRSGARGSW